jgi:hypothetical protein
VAQVKRLLALIRDPELASLFVKRAAVRKLLSTSISTPLHGVV